MHPNYRLSIDAQTREAFYETSLQGQDLLREPLLNKGTAFTRQERRVLGLNGCLPHAVEDLKAQVERAYQEYQEHSTPLSKNNFLSTLHDTNETLYFRLVLDRISELLPIIYTPTAGLAIEHYSHEFRRPRGLYITATDGDRIEQILDQRAVKDVDLILATDSEAILGIGDQGVGGIGISIAKLAVYTLCAGIHPARTLPVVLDVGTNRKELLDDPLYLGWRHERLCGEDYDRFIDRFVTAVDQAFPHVLLHWEDLGRDNACRILTKYRPTLCTFNDDMQGTGAVACSAMLAAVHGLGQKFTSQRVVIYGAGTAGCGIADRVAAFMEKQGLDAGQARARIWCLDRQGLLLSNMEDLTPAQAAYARNPEEVHDWARGEGGQISLEEAVRRVKPTILVGTSTRAGAFTREIIQGMAQDVERPVVLPMSNPNRLCEATPEDILEWTGGRAMVATGSPFPDVSCSGRNIRIGGCNNAYIFPGIGLGAVVVRSRSVSEAMINAAVEAMATLCPAWHDPDTPLMPVLEQVREISRAVALAVARQAGEEGLATQEHEDLEQAVEQAMWKPGYIPVKPVQK